MKIATLAATSLLAVTPAFAQAPAGNVPLSEILAGIEAQADFASIKSVEWDDDRWEIEYELLDGSEVEVEIDPVTGEPRDR